MLIYLLILTALVSASLANKCKAALFHDFVVHENRTIPDGFSWIEPAQANATIELRLALTHRDLSGLQEVFSAISTPGNPSYGQHLTQQEVAHYVRPRNKTVSIVEEFLSSYGVQDARALSPSGDWLLFSVPVGTANAMFNTMFHVFRHDASGRTGVRTLAYSIPRALKGHVELVHPTVSFDFAAQPQIAGSSSRKTAHAHAGRAADAPANSCADAILPNCLQALYSLPDAPIPNPSNTTLLVTGFSNEYPQYADVASFLSQTRPDLPANETTFEVVLRTGGEDPQAAKYAGVEANLDVQYTVGLVSGPNLGPDGVPVVFLSEGDSGLGGVADINTYLQEQETPPNVVSTSYGFDEVEVDSFAARRICTDFVQAGARGVSLIFSSGDGGVGGSHASTVCTTFRATFPAGCPYVTSVSAVLSSSAVTGSSTGQNAANLSAGGFSTLFPRSAGASYQDAVVSSYLSSYLNSSDVGAASQYEAEGLFNAAGRAYPDVALAGTNYGIVSGGRQFLVNGTSAAAPVFASLISLANVRLAAAGRAPLGFLNPLLYSAGAQMLFEDVTEGDNPGCGTPGFPASPGWDPVTGLGTPDFERLMAVLGL